MVVVGGYYADPFWYDPYFVGPQWGPYPYPYPYQWANADSAVKLEVKPKEAEVYVDGYYAGIVDEFDGHFQHLDLTPGPHHIRIEQAGYATLTFDVNIVAHKKIDYRAEMKPAVPVQ